MYNKQKMSGVNQLLSIDKIFKEDDDDFTPSVGSNLAAIFGTSQKSQGNTRVNSPLRSGSSKQSVVDQNQSQTSASTKENIILATAVHAFKLQNGQYVSIGKIGIALIRNTIAKQYHVILYKGTQNYISVVQITSDFGYTIQANNYASYYDTNKDNWSILFESNESSAQFAREICLCRYFSKTNRNDNKVIYQDLSEASKDATAKEGDGISIKYLTSIDMSQPLKIDNNLKQTITLELSKDDNWERLLVGTSMGMRRMMILPPNKQIGLGPGFPKDKEIVMEIEIVSVFTKEGPPPLTPKPPEVSQKATIISRMAKMGQSILPKLPPSTTTDSEDTEEEVFHKTSRHKRIESTDSSLSKKHSYSNPPSDVTPRKVLNRGELMPSSLPFNQRSILSAPTTFASQWAQSQIQQQYLSIDGQLLPIQQQTIAQPIPASMDPSLNVFLSESRTQNTELRMGLSKISDNVQKLLDKFHVLELQQVSSPSSDKSLAATLKMFIDTNKSKQNTENKDREIQCVLSRQEATEDQNLLSRNKELNSKLDAIESKLKEANESIITKSRCIDELNQQNDVLKQTNSVLTDRIKDLEEQLSSSQSKLLELSYEYEQSKDIGSIYQEENSKLENCITELATQCKEMERNMWKSETTDWVDKSKEIKEIMNEIFQELCDSFSEENYTADYIKSTIHSTLRNITFRIVSEESEKKQEKVRRIKEEAATSVSKPDTNQHLKLIKNYGIDEDAMPTMPNNDIGNLTVVDSNIVSGLRNEPPPLPTFDLEGSN